MKALLASGLSIIPIIPGFIASVSKSGTFPDVLVEFYNYAWFISFGLSFIIYYLINYFSPLKYKLQQDDKLIEGIKNDKVFSFL